MKRIFEVWSKQMRNRGAIWLVLLGGLLFAVAYGFADYIVAVTCFSAGLAFVMAVLAETLWLAIRSGIHLIIGISLSAPLLYIGAAIQRRQFGSLLYYLDGLKVSMFMGCLILFPWILILPITYFGKRLLKYKR